MRISFGTLTMSKSKYRARIVKLILFFNFIFLLNYSTAEAQSPPEPINGWTFSNFEDDEQIKPLFGEALGALSGTVDWSDEDPFGRDGSASFSGGGVVIMEDLADSFNGLSNFTLSMWIKSNETNIDKGFWEAVDNGGSDLWGLRYDKSGASAGGANVIKLGIVTSESGGNLNRGVDQQESQNNVQTTEWQHIVITWEDGSGFKLYIDGKIDEPTLPMANTSGTLSEMDRFVIGKGPKANWDGLIDEVAVWDLTLSEENVYWLFENSIEGLSGGEAGKFPPYVSKLTASPNSVDILIKDVKGGTKLKLETVEVAIDGTEVEVNSLELTKGAYSIFYDNSKVLYDSGSTHDIIISFTDTDEKIIKIAKEFKIKKYVSVKPSFIVSPSKKGESGIAVYPTQISWGQNVESIHGNNINGAKKQFIGEFIDRETKEIYVNELDPEADVKWSYYPEIIEVVNQTLDDSFPSGNFQDTGTGNSTDRADSLITGLPGWGDSNDGVVSEFVALVQLGKGIHRFGVNSDDGFIASIGANLGDAFSQELGSFNGGRGASSSEFDFYISEAGLYPYRVLWWQGGGGASIELYSYVGKEKVLINDTELEGAIKSYVFKDAVFNESINSRVGTARPYIKSITPSPGSVADEGVSITVIDKFNELNSGSLTLLVNGKEAPVSISTDGDSTIVSCDQTDLFIGENNLNFSYSELSGKSRSENWQIRVLKPATAEAPKSKYTVPQEGWKYSLDVTDISAWDHNNGSDAWDGSAIGGEFGDGNRPGGVSVIDGFVRIQDSGDPRDYGFSDPGSNRKIYLGKNIAEEGGTDTILDDGATLHFMARIPTEGLIDPVHVNGGGGVEDYPAGGDGYENHDGGKGNIGIKQGAGGIVSFSLNEAGKVIVGDGGTEFELTTTEWHEFWVTIRKNDAGHEVRVYIDGSTEPQVLNVTAGGGSDYDGTYLAIGAGSTGKSGALDVAAFNFKPGAHVPAGADPIDVAPPSISVARNADGTVTVTFEGTLQTAPTVNGPWEDVAGESPLTIPASEAAAFGRAKN
tara:strand:- start:5597 stop:8707 length:3111 start_codon:yes stop_codon:yes gene_type:complete